MDFAVCPTCGQSVLDDDAENCPFCGSSMKAKPGGKPAGKAAAPTTTAAKPAPKPAGKPASKPAEDDFPFDAETNLPQTAVPVSPTQTKSKSLKVVCPMCDTAGFVPESAAGKQVRCANAKCHMPIFTVPAPKVEAAPPPPPKKNNLVMLGAATALIVCTLGGAWYMFQGRSPTVIPDPPALTQADIDKMKQKGSGQGTTDSTTKTDQTTSTTDQTTANTGTAPAAATPAQLIAQAIKMMPEVSVQSSQNRSRPYCRRLAAESAAISGDIPAAREHMDQLLKIGGADLAFYRTSPGVDLFWLERAQGNANSATETLNRAVTDAAKLPKQGRDQLDVATRLAAALAAAGRAAEGREIIKLHQTPGIEGEVSAYLQSIAADASLVDARQRIELRPIVPRQAPQAAAATAILILRGESAAAREWAKGWTEPHIKAECLTALVEAAVAGLVTELPEAEIAALPAENQVLLRSRAARMQAARNQGDAAKESLAKAAASLESITPPAEFALPDMKGLVRWKAAAPEPLVTLAAGAAELAVAQHIIAKDDAAAAKALEVSIQACRALGPAITPIERLQTEASDAGGLREKLKRELELRTNDQATQQMGLYRRALNDIAEGSQERFRLQTTILSRAAQLGLEDAVWTIVSPRASDADPTRREAYFPTDVTSWLVERFNARKASDQAQAVKAAAAEAVPGGIKRPVLAELEEQIAAGKYREAAALLQRPDVKSDLREALVLMATLRLAAQDPIENTWKFISPIGDVVLREQGCEWAALIAARRNQGAAVLKHIDEVNGATEKISLGRGLVAGLVPLRDKK